MVSASRASNAGDKEAGGVTWRGATGIDSEQAARCAVRPVLTRCTEPERLREQEDGPGDQTLGSVGNAEECLGMRRGDNDVSIRGCR